MQSRPLRLKKSWKMDNARTPRFNRFSILRKAREIAVQEKETHLPRGLRRLLGAHTAGGGGQGDLPTGETNYSVETSA